MAGFFVCLFVFVFVLYPAVCRLHPPTAHVYVGRELLGYVSCACYDAVAYIRSEINCYEASFSFVYTTRTGQHVHSTFCLRLCFKVFCCVLPAQTATTTTR